MPDYSALYGILKFVFYKIFSTTCIKRSFATRTVYGTTAKYVHLLKHNFGGFLWENFVARTSSAK